MNDAAGGGAAGGQVAPEPPGTLVATGARAAVRFERALADPPDAVWPALTEPAGLKSWFPCEIVAERWEAGAALRFEFPGHEEYTMDGVVLACDAPRALAYTWGEETLRFELAPTDAGGTRLVLVDELDRNIAARNAAGWHVCLEHLAGRVPADGVWRPLFARYTSAFEPVLGPQEGPPAGFEGDA